MDNYDENPFWGEPTPTDLWEDMKKLNALYDKLQWDHRDYLEFTIEGNHITIRNKSREGCLLYTSPSPRDLSTSRMPSSA